jgi:hypothetical protein
MGLFKSRTSLPELDGISGVGGGTGLLDRTRAEEEELTTEDGDHERFSHYVLKEKIVESAVTGKAVKALCGKKWVPNRDPEKFPICPTCKEIHAGLKKPDQSE